MIYIVDSHEKAVKTDIKQTKNILCFSSFCENFEKGRGGLGDWRHGKNRRFAGFFNKGLQILLMAQRKEAYCLPVQDFAAALFLLVVLLLRYI